VALFKQYEKGNPLRDEWEEAHSKGFKYWESQGISQTENGDISKVAGEAKQGYSDAIKSEHSSTALALGLGRAMTRFKLVSNFKNDVVPTVTEAAKSLATDSEPWSEARANFMTKQAFEAMDNAFASQGTGTSFQDLFRKIGVDIDGTMLKAVRSHVIEENREMASRAGYKDFAYNYPSMYGPTGAWKGHWSQKVLRYSVDLYFDYMLRPTVYFMDTPKGNLYTMAVVGVLTGWFFLMTVYGLCNLVEQPRELGTLKAMEHWPATPALLAFATHLVMALYGKRQLRDFKQDQNHGVALPYPVLFTFFVGKGFMMFRLTMSYSSGKMSNALNFFVYQEFLLTLTHVFCSAIILPRYSQHSHIVKDMSNVMKFILYMDTAKTMLTFLFWLSFTPGYFADYYDRLPSVATQVYASLLIHGVLDVMQSAATVFTVYIARHFSAYVGKPHPLGVPYGVPGQKGGP